MSHQNTASLGHERGVSQMQDWRIVILCILEGPDTKIGVVVDL